MPVTISVYYRNGLKRGPACGNATFGQWLSEGKAGFLMPGVRRLVPLPIRSRQGNTYVLEPQTAPLDPSSLAVTIRVESTGEPGRGRAPGSAEVGMDYGDTAEVWI